VVLAALVFALGALAAVLWPGDFRTILQRGRETRQIGVPIGVADATAAAPVVQNSEAPPVASSSAATKVTNAPSAQSTPPVASEVVTDPAPAIASANQSAESNSQAARAEDPPAAVARTDDSSTKIVSNKSQPEPPPPAAGPDDSSSNVSVDDPQQPVPTQQDNVSAGVVSSDAVSQSAPKNVKQSTVADAAESKGRAKSKATVSTTKPRTSAATKRARTVQVQPDAALPPLRSGNYRARFLGTTADGNLVLGLPSGDTAIVTPQSSERYGRRRSFFERRRLLIPPPPFGPPFPPVD
jgi:hypothetical protein